MAPDARSHAMSRLGHTSCRAWPGSRERTGSTSNRRSAPRSELSLARSPRQTATPPVLSPWPEDGARTSRSGVVRAAVARVTVCPLASTGSCAGTRGLAGRTQRRRHHTAPAPPQEPVPPSSPLTPRDTFLQGSPGATAMPSPTRWPRNARAHAQDRVPQPIRGAPPSTETGPRHEGDAPP
jgi:hypothetical protein